MVVPVCEGKIRIQAPPMCVCALAHPKRKRTLGPDRPACCPASRVHKRTQGCSNFSFCLHSFPQSSLFPSSAFLLLPPFCLCSLNNSDFSHFYPHFLSLLMPILPPFPAFSPSFLFSTPLAPPPSVPLASLFPFIFPPLSHYLLLLHPPIAPHRPVLTSTVDKSEKTSGGLSSSSNNDENNSSPGSGNTGGFMTI